MSNNEYLQIRELRLAAGLTVTGFARLIDYNYKTVCGWECRGKMPSSRALVDIARVLGCSVNDLYRPEVRTW